MKADFVPADVLDEAFKFWWAVVILMFIGAGVGWFFSMINPPIYEAVNSISVSIDFVHTGKLTDIEEDHALGVVGSVIQSNDVVNRVVERAKSESIDIDPAAFQQAATAERQFYIWLLRVRHRDPKIAARLATIWGETAYEMLNDALQHAFAADGYQRADDALLSCFQAIVSQPVYGICNSSNQADIQSEIQKTNQLVYQERTASQGILAYTSFSKPGGTKVSNNPVQNSRSLLIFSGSIAGFILAVGALLFLHPSRFGQKVKRVPAN